jgi:hypothetical protein
MCSVRFSFFDNGSILNQLVNHCTAFVILK